MPTKHIDIIQKYHLSNLFTTDFTVRNNPAFLSNFVTRVRSLGLELSAHYNLQSFPAHHSQVTYANEITLVRKLSIAPTRLDRAQADPDSRASFFGFGFD